MKRTPLTRHKPLGRGKGLKRSSTLAKKSKQPISRLKRKLWDEFSKYIRHRDGGICFICDRRAEGSGYHAGHFIPKSVGGIALYFHENNVHGCCYNCNINLGGNLYLYGQRLGKEMCDELYKLKGQINKVDAEWYKSKIEYYGNLNKLNE